MKKCGIGLLLLMVLKTAYADQASTTLYDWTEFAPNNQMQERVITTQSTCPDQSMQISHVSDNGFPITVCKKSTPSDLKFNPTRIVIIGDTGCRIKKGVKPQDCDNPHYWPFSETAKSAAKWKPDLVIDVGDYLYRESACPPGDKDCANSPHGDNWATWQADFFKPAKPLLNAAPWIFVRGNHEICSRAGHGWNLLLDPFGFKHCLDYSPIYSVDIGDTRLFIMDSSSANDYMAPSNQANWFYNYLQLVLKSHAKYNWVVTHKPFWFIYSEDPLHQIVQKHVLNTLQAAWTYVRPDNVDLLLSGHIHRFQAINLPKPVQYPPQLIAGTGGARLDSTLENSNLQGLSVAGETIKQGFSLNDFGFVTMEKQADESWKVDLRSPAGKVKATCLFKDQQLICVETKHHEKSKG